MIEHYIIVIATSAPLSAYTLGAIVGATSITTVGLMNALNSYKPSKEKKE